MTTIANNDNNTYNDGDIYIIYIDGVFQTKP